MPRTHLTALALISLSAACGSEQIILEGVVAPQPNTCVFEDSSIFLINGEMEIGKDNTANNQYIAVIRASVRNDGWGSRGWQSAVTVEAATVRYEYPTLSQVASVTAGQVESHPPADGSIPADGKGHITVKLLERSLSQRLADDSDFQDRLVADGSVPVLCHIRLEGKTAEGTRATSTELTFRIETRPPATLNNCSSLACPAGTSKRMNAQCFFGQDQIACFCQ